MMNLKSESSSKLKFSSLEEIVKRTDEGMFEIPIMWYLQATSEGFGLAEARMNMVVQNFPEYEFTIEDSPRLDVGQIIRWRKK